MQQQDGHLNSGLTDVSKDSRQKEDGSLIGVEGNDSGQSNPLKDLKAEVLSIDWEITDKVMTRFIGEVNRLRDIYRDDKVLFSFMQLLHSIGKYVKTKKGKAHPNAIKLLNSVYNSLEKVVQLKGANESERKKILSEEVERFKKLRAEIAHKNSETGTKKVKSPLVQTKPVDKIKKTIQENKKEKWPGPKDEPPKGDADYQALFAALEEVKDFISGEFNVLRAELKLLRKEARGQQ